MSLGATLKMVRQQHGWTQKRVATGLCSQSLLSAIEHDHYRPNAQLFMALCRRLGISLDQVSLAQGVTVSPTAAVDQRLEQLCNRHEYAALKADLLAPTTVAQVVTDAQTQAYYYYLGVAEFQIDPSLTAAGDHLRLAVNLGRRRHPLTTMTRLSWAAFALVTQRQGRPQAAKRALRQAITGIERAAYEKNLNIVFYLAALMTCDQPVTATQWLQRGIAFATQHDTHYLLANDYYLLAQLAARQSDPTGQRDAQQKSQFLTDLFHEKVYRPTGLSEF